VKKQLLRVLAVILTVIILLTCVTSAVYGYWGPPPQIHKLELDMSHYKTSSRGVCSLCAGTSIGQYYRDEYDDLPSSATMYDRLEVYMDTGIIFPYVNPINYGPGFVEMALHYGYDNFSYDHDDYVTTGDWDAIVNAINHGWPVALTATQQFKGFKDVPALLPESDGDGSWPCEVRHWIAIKGYYYERTWWGAIRNRRIICTDSYSRADSLWLDWNVLVAEVGADNLEYVIIKDEDNENDGFVENFEWGSGGASLEDWQNLGGEVDWEVTIGSGGNSIVEIDDGVYHGESGQSARFYRDGSKVVYAYYSLWQPSLIDFWVKKDNTAYTKIANGNGDKYIWVRINDAEEIQYYGPDGYTTLSYKLQVNSWQHIEFKNIDWESDPGTYDIYVNGSRKARGATMRSGPGYRWGLYFGSWTGSGTFWIDDIKDSLVQP
jgi:hypothetical protein